MAQWELGVNARAAAGRRLDHARPAEEPGAFVHTREPESARLARVS